MSVVATALMAGAAVSINAAANDIVTSLYQALKAKISKILTISFAEIESQPASESAQKALENTIKETNLDGSDDILQLAKLLLDEINKVDTKLPEAILIRTRDLVSKGDIEFSNIELGGSLLQAETVKTDGRFTVKDIKHHNESGAAIDPVVTIGTAIAKVIHISIGKIAEKFNDLPRYIKSIIVLLFMLLLVIISIPIYSGILSNAQKKHHFDEIYNRQWSAMGSEFMSSTNYLSSVIPQNIVQTSNVDHWQRVNYSWTKHFGRMTDFLTPLAACLSNGTCIPGEKGREVCQIATSRQAAHAYIHDRLQSIDGINLDYTGGGGGLGGVFGPNIVVPSAAVVNYISENHC